MPAALPTQKIGKALIYDVRGLFPNQPGGSTGRRRVKSDLVGVAVHHDAVLFQGGDRDASGETLDEDLERLHAIYKRGIEQGWGGFPYHFVASPNKRCFYTQSFENFGAHCAKRNHELVGVALMGNLSGAMPGPGTLIAAGLALLAITGFAGRFLSVRGHREWALTSDPTACPGRTLQRWRPNLLLVTAGERHVGFGN